MEILFSIVSHRKKVKLKAFLSPLFAAGGVLNKLIVSCGALQRGSGGQLQENAACSIQKNQKMFNKLQITCLLNI